VEPCLLALEPAQQAARLALGSRGGGRGNVIAAVGAMRRREGRGGGDLLDNDGAGKEAEVEPAPRELGRGARRVHGRGGRGSRGGGRDALRGTGGAERQQAGRVGVRYIGRRNHSITDVFFRCPAHFKRREVG